MKNKVVDLSNYKNILSRKNQVVRFVWNIAWLILVRPFPRSIGNTWKLLLLRLFGAKLHRTSVVYSSAKIYMPWNLEMAEFSCIGPGVDCYNVSKIKLGAHTTVSQRAFLCTASHDISKSNHPLIVSPIIINPQSWVAAESFIGPGVTIGEGAVIAARAVVVKDVEPWTVVGGNPAKFIKKRVIEN